MTIKQTPKILSIVFLLIFAFTIPLWLGSYWTQTVTMGMVIGITAMSFILLTGYCGVVSFAQMSFYAMAAYVFALTIKDYHWPTYISIPLAILGAVILSAIFGAIAIRSKGIFFLMMTLALSQLFSGLMLDWQSVTHGYSGFTGVARPSIFGFSLMETNPRYYTTLVALIICYLILLRIVSSPFGLSLQGMQDNTRRMKALGFNTDLRRFVAILISGFFAGIGGILGIFSTGSVSPATGDLSANIMVLMAALIGGIWRLKGGILGGIIVIFLINFTKQFTSRYWLIIGIIFILIMIFLPNGLLGINFSRISSKIKSGFKKNKQPA
jgi:branched-chain amino acid transport system permease protein